MTPYTPHSGPSNPSSPTPSRAALATLSSDARLDLILALLETYPAGSSIAFSHLQAAEQEAASPESEEEPLPDFRELAQSIGPLLDKYRRSKGVPDAFAAQIVRELYEGVPEMMEMCRNADRPGALTAFFAALTELAELFAKSRNEQIIRELDAFGEYIERYMTIVWQMMEKEGEAEAVKEEYTQKVKELEGMYEEWDADMRFRFLWAHMAGLTTPSGP